MVRVDNRDSATGAPLNVIYRCEIPQPPQPTCTGNHQAALPAGATRRAGENGTFNSRGGTVYYGDQATNCFNRRTVGAGATRCNNASLGDPIRGTAKACYLVENAPPANVGTDLTYTRNGNTLLNPKVGGYPADVCDGVRGCYKPSADFICGDARMGLSTSSEHQIFPLTARAGNGNTWVNGRAFTRITCGGQSNLAAPANCTTAREGSGLILGCWSKNGTEQNHLLKANQIAQKIDTWRDNYISHGYICNSRRVVNPPNGRRDGWRKRIYRNIRGGIITTFTLRAEVEVLAQVRCNPRR